LRNRFQQPIVFVQHSCLMLHVPSANGLQPFFLFESHRASGQ
jgi:hypothetical protein